MTIVTIDTAGGNLAKLIEQALRGEEVIIAEDGKPMVRLVPVAAPQGKRRFGALRGQLHVPDSFFEPLSEEELKLWEGES
jgi:prevent-host-death family protein